MNRILILLCACLLALASCRPKGPAEEQVVATPPADLNSVTVSDVSVEVNDRRMTVAWKKSGSRAISGYNIYISETPGGSRPVNSEPFPGDTDPEDGIEHYVAEGLENGVKYFVSVAVVYPDLSLSQRSPGLVTVCGPRGEIELSIRHRGEHTGYSFEKNTYVDCDDVTNDLYFFSNDETDMLVSPSQLDGFLNDNKFMVLAYDGEFRQVADRVMQTPLTASEDRVSVTPGEWVLVQTAAGKNALIHVAAITGQGDQRTIRLEFAYSTLVGEAFF